MSLFDQKPHDIALDQAISDILTAMNGLPKDSKEYDAASDQLVKLMKLKRENNPSWRPSPDALVGAAGSVLGIIMILHFEKVGVVTSKALSFVRQMK